MSTQLTTASARTKGMSLMLQLMQIRELSSVWPSVHEARTARPLRSAISTLHNFGYHLSSFAMVEGDFYQLTYSPDWLEHEEVDPWVTEVKLRLITQESYTPLLAICYRDGDGTIVHYTGSRPTVHGTGTSDASKMQGSFRRHHPDMEMLWMPALGDDGTWFQL